ncbi:MAG: hypothetical protein ACO1Q7_05650 [Gemmatimonas sp.]
MRTQSGNSTRTATLVGLLALSVLSACASDSTQPLDELSGPSGSSSGTRNDTTRNTPTAPGNAVAGIRIMSRDITLLMDGSVGVVVMPVNENGIPSLALLATRPTLSVSHPGVVAVDPATYSIRGTSAGTAKLYATLGQLRDSVQVTVLAERDTLRGRPTVPPPVPPARPDSTRPTPPAPPTRPDSTRPTVPPVPPTRPDTTRPTVPPPAPPVRPDSARPAPPVPPGRG